jgi:hypothetical protein
MHGRVPGDAERQARVVALIEQQIDLLQRYEDVEGGWCYYDFRIRTQRPAGSSTSFLTAAVLVALHEAQGLGIEVPERLVQRAVDSVVRQRNPDFSYWYGSNYTWRPHSRINTAGGTLSRSQACNLALRLWGDPAITDRVIESWLDRFFARRGWLDIARKKPVPHESWFAVSGYFCHYGDYYAARCLDELEPAPRTRCAAHLAGILLEQQETDGSWWDYPLYDYHQQYGTGYVLAALRRCRIALTKGVRPS